MKALSLLYNLMFVKVTYVRIRGVKYVGVAPFQGVGLERFHVYSGFSYRGHSKWRHLHMYNGDDL